MRSAGDTRTDTGVGPFSRAWRFFEWNLRPSSFTPAQGHDRGNGDRTQGRERQAERSGDFSEPPPF
jgi:hypothetical protein